jgi:hypothetical protein
LACSIATIAVVVAWVVSWIKITNVTRIVGMVLQRRMEYQVFRRLMSQVLVVLQQK